MALIGVLFVAMVFLPVRSNQEFTTLLQYPNFSKFVSSPLVYPYANFDGVHYLNIAARGYIDEGRFFPLFPALMKVISAPFLFIFGREHLTVIVLLMGTVLSSVFFLLALLVLEKLLLLDYKQKFVDRVIDLLILFPTSFFFISVYSESLFLLLSVLIFWYVRKSNWFLASVLSMFLSVSRLSGVLIGIPLLFEFLYAKKNRVLSEYKSILWFVLIPLLLFVYMYYNFVVWDDVLFFVHAHSQLGNSRETSSIVFPLITVYRYLKIFITVSMQQYEYWVAVIEFKALVLGSLFLFYAYLSKVRVSYILYAILIFLFPILSGTLTGLPRYMLPVFPLFVGYVFIIQALEKRFPTHKKVLVFGIYACSILLQIVLFALFARSYFIA